MALPYNDLEETFVITINNTLSTEYFTKGLAYDLGTDGIQDYQKALQWYEKAAELGHPWAPNNLGVLYRNGFGVQQDFDKAYEYFSKSNNPDALCNLAKMYYFGNGRKIDKKKARTIFRRGAKKDSPLCQYNLGLMYLRGEGGTQNYNQAAEMFEQAHKHNFVPAQLLLSTLLKHGLGIEKDEDASRKLYDSAVASLDKDLLYQIIMHDIFA